MSDIQQALKMKIEKKHFKHFLYLTVLWPFDIFALFNLHFSFLFSFLSPYTILSVATGATV